MLDFKKPQTSKKRDLEASMSKNTMLLPSLLKTTKMRFGNPRKSLEIQAWNPKASFRVLPSPPASLDGPQGAKLGATSMPNDTFWAPNFTESAPIFAMNLKTRDVETASRHQRASTHFGRDTSKNIQQTTG